MNKYIQVIMNGNERSIEGSSNLDTSYDFKKSRLYLGYKSNVDYLGQSIGEKNAEYVGLATAGLLGTGIIYLISRGLGSFSIKPIRNESSQFPPFNLEAMRNAIYYEAQELRDVSDEDIHKFYNFYKSLYENNQYFTVYRVVGIAQGKEINMSALGGSWAMQEQAALNFINKMVVYLDDNPDEPVYYKNVPGLQIFLLSGKVHRDNIDWSESLFLGPKYSWQELAYLYPDENIDFILSKMADDTSDTEAEVELVVRNSHASQFQDLDITLVDTVR